MPVKYDTGHHAGATPEARISNPLRNSGDAARADHVVQKGTGPTRVFHNVFDSANHVAPRDTRNVDIRRASHQAPPGERK